MNCLFKEIDALPLTFCEFSFDRNALFRVKSQKNINTTRFPGVIAQNVHEYSLFLSVFFFFLNCLCCQTFMLWNGDQKSIINGLQPTKRKWCTDGFLYSFGKSNCCCVWAWVCVWFEQYKQSELAAFSSKYKRLCNSYWRTFSFFDHRNFDRISILRGERKRIRSRLKSEPISNLTIKQTQIITGSTAASATTRTEQDPFECTQQSRNAIANWVLFHTWPGSR